MKSKTTPKTIAILRSRVAMLLLTTDDVTARREHEVFEQMQFVPTCVESAAHEHRGCYSDSVRHGIVPEALITTAPPPAWPPPLTAVALGSMPGLAAGGGDGSGSFAPATAQADDVCAQDAHSLR